MALTKVTTGGITDATIATADIADDAVTAAKIADTSITSGQLSDDSVITAKIAASAVNDGKLASNSVTTAKIADDAVTLAKMADDSVSASQIINNAVTVNALAADAVTTPKIADAQVTAAKLASGVRGKIRQVKTLIYTTVASTTSSTASDLGMQLQITPTATSNTILILTGMIQLGLSNDVTSVLDVVMDSGSGFGIPEETRGPDRNSRTRVHSGRGYQADNSDQYRALPTMMYAMITPDNTNQHTIKIQWRQMDDNAHTLYLNRTTSDNNAAWITSPQSTMTVMEVDVS